MTSPVRTSSRTAFVEAIDYVLEMVADGRVASFSAHLDPTGIGRISFTTDDVVSDVDFETDTDKE